MLDWWLGPEGIQYFREHQIREIIKRHIAADEADVDQLEGLGVLNFLDLDDLAISHEGETLDPESIIKLPFVNGRAQFPEIKRTASDPFLQKIQKSEKKWVVIVDENEHPQLVLDADGFLRQAVFGTDDCNPYNYCHGPLVSTEESDRVGDVISKFEVFPDNEEDDVIDQDIILVWGGKKRIITGADLFGRLMRGIAVSRNIYNEHEY
jgi:hypothetical protein